MNEFVLVPVQFGFLNLRDSLPEIKEGDIVTVNGQLFEIRKEGKTYALIPKG